MQDAIPLDRHIHLPRCSPAATPLLVGALHGAIMTLLAAPAGLFNGFPVAIAGDDSGHPTVGIVAGSLAPAVDPLDTLRCARV